MLVAGKVAIIIVTVIGEEASFYHWSIERNGDCKKGEWKSWEHGFSEI